MESDDDFSAPRGGELDPFGKGKMHKPFEKACFELKKGQLSKTVETDWGFHVTVAVHWDRGKKIAMFCIFFANFRRARSRLYQNE